MKMKISIVIPLFNKAAYIEETLRALLAQLYEGDEILVIDDCSTDDGLAIASKTLEGVAAARILQMARNSGPASARNAGARAATGTHLLFFDADDCPAADLLHVLHEAIERFPAESVFAFWIAFQARGESLPAGQADYALRIVRRERHAFAKDSLKGRTLCTASSTCVKRTSFLSARGFQDDLRYCEDPELWARLSAQYPIMEIQKVLAMYRDVQQSLSYAWRGRVGAVNPYVDSLLKMADQYRGPYQQLASMFILKNIVLARGAGVSVSRVKEQIDIYRNAVGPCFYFKLCALSVVPGFLFRAFLKRRAVYAPPRNPTLN